MNDLPKIYYDVVYYLVIKDYSPKKTAKELNITEDNVRSRFESARQMLTNA
jgi:DNA-directed RNA polymerase specialized sigma24 family protein